jgi:hypothetical protein
VRIWLIDEGAPGHRAQSEGVLAAMRRLGCTTDVVGVPAADRLPGVWRAPARFAVDRALPSASWLARRVSAFEEPAHAPPDLILSSGGKSAFASVVLARRTGAPNLFVGDPRPYPLRWFTAILSPRPIAGCARVRGVAAPPTAMTPARAEAAAAARWPAGPPSPAWTLLVGGASRSHRFTPADFDALGRAAAAAAERFGIRWLIATSRRSGAAADEMLEAALPAAAIAEATWFSRNPEPVVPAYLGAGEAVFVTQDSLTMLAEALTSGRPVTALFPREVRLPAGSLVTDMLARFERLPGCVRAPVTSLHEVAPGKKTPPHAEVVARLDAAVANVLCELRLT